MGFKDSNFFFFPPNIPLFPTNFMIRKRPVDATGSEFDSAMNMIFQILMNVSRDFLNGSMSNSGSIDENEYEFAESICESMVALGSSNMQCILVDRGMTSQFLQQVILPLRCKIPL